MNYIMAVMLADEVAQHIGKKGSENGLTYYNGIHNGDRMVALAPSSIEDKFYAVPEAMLLSDAVVIGTSSIGKRFGELLIAASLSGKKVLLTKEGDASAMLDGLGMDVEYSDKFEVAEKVARLGKAAVSGGCRVDIDKAFQVTGIGTVALGFVTKGRVSVHDRLFLPSGQEVTVKSIQSNDVDVESAEIGTRVGLALKGPKPEDIRKGDLLCASRVEPVTAFAASITETKIAKEEIVEGNTYGFVTNFSYTNAAVISTADGASLRLERPIAMQEGDAFMLLRQREPRVFARGSAKAMA